MSMMIIGADHLGKIKDRVKNLGFSDIIHISGRKKSSFRSFKLPVGIDMVLVLTNYVNHSAMEVVKKKAKEKGIDLIFAKRSWSFIYKKLQRRKVVS